MHPPTPLVPLLALLAGCDWIGQLEGYTNPMVMEATVVGIDTSNVDTADLTGTAFEGGTVATVLLADATQAEDLEEAPIGGAKVELQVDGGAWMPFREEDDGAYLIDEGLDYAAGQELTIRIRGGEEGEHGASLRAPSPLDVEIPPEQPMGQTLVLSTDAPGVAHLAVVVLDLATGELLFDNRPNNIEAVYALTHGEGQLALEVPGVVFSRPGAYLVGVAGLGISAEESLVNVNTTISALTAGTIRFYPVEVRGTDAPG